MNYEYLTHLTFALIMSYLFYASKSRPKYGDNGSMILKLPDFYYLFGLCMIIAGIGLLFYLYCFDNDIEKKFGIIFSSIAIIPGLILFAKGYVYRIIINDKGILEYNMFGKQNEIKWDEIKHITFGKISKELSIKSENKNIKAHFHLEGFPTLVEILEKKTRIRVQDLILNVEN